MTEDCGAWKMVTRKNKDKGKMFKVGYTYNLAQDYLGVLRDLTPICHNDCGKLECKGYE